MNVLAHRNRISLAIIISLFIFLVPSARLAVAYTITRAVYAPSNYTTLKPPANGGSYTDAVFGTAIKRISDAMHTTDAAKGGAVTLIAQEYSTMSPFNMDNTRLLLQHFSYFGLYDGAGNFLKDLYQYGISTSTEPRWSRTDPNEFYYVVGNALKKFDVETNASTTVHIFSEYSTVSGMGESDISFDGKYFVLAGDRRYVFLYDLTTDTKGSVFDPGASGRFDNLYITPDNNVIIGWYANGSGRYNGVELYDKNMNFQRQLTHAMGHMDVTRDTNGEEVMLWANGADSQLQVRCDAGVTKIRLSDAKQTCVWTGDWSLAIHVSATDDNGWFFVDTYNPNDVMPPTGWVTYTDEILQISTDGSEVRRLAHHRSRPLNSYTYQPKASVSRDGSKLVYTSNYGLQNQLGYPKEYTDTYLIDLGSSGSTGGNTGGGDTGTGVPDGQTSSGTTRVEETSSAVTYTGSWFSNANGIHSGSSAKGSMDVNSFATLKFNGTGVSFILYKDEWAGIASITVDGVFKAELDTYSTPQKAQSNAYTVTGLTNGPHTVSITPTGRRNPSSGGLWIWVDAFDVTTDTTITTPPSTPPPTTTPPPPPPPPTNGSYRVEQSNPAVRWTGTWSLNNNIAHSGGSARLSMDAGSRTTFTFTGTSVRWVGYKDQWSGIARVFLDGVLKDSVDMYEPGNSTQAQVAAYTFSELPSGTHTIVVEATGTKRSTSRGSWVWVDAFDYAGDSLTSSPQLSDPSSSVTTVHVGRGQTVATSGGGQPMLTGSAQLIPDAGSELPSGLAIFGYRSNGILVTEAAVPASAPVLKGRILAEANGPVDTGLAVANPNNSPATVSFFFTDRFGMDSGNGKLILPPYGQIARFLDQAPFNVARPANGTFTFSSDVPIAAVALRGFLNERLQFLLTTLPVADLDVPNPATTFFPHVAEGGGWVTQFALVNPTDETITGNVLYLGETTAYSIAPRGSQTLSISSPSTQLRTGPAEVTPDRGNIAPGAVAILSFTKSEVTVTEAGVPSMSIGDAFRIYAEFDESIRTGIAVQNHDETATAVTFELTQLDGTRSEFRGSLEIPPLGERAIFLNEIPGFESLPSPFKGLLRISSSSSGAISVLGLRTRTNERGDFMITTIPAADEKSVRANQLIFPHVVDGGGYSTEFITFGAGNLQLFSQSGGALGLTLR